MCSVVHEELASSVVVADILESSGPSPNQERVARKEAQDVLPRCAFHDSAHPFELLGQQTSRLAGRPFGFEENFYGVTQRDELL